MSLISFDVLLLFFLKFFLHVAVLQKMMTVNAVMCAFGASFPDTAIMMGMIGMMGCLFILFPF